MDVIINRASINDLDKLLEWRMEVLHSVFKIPQNENMQALYCSNLEYYKQTIPSETHIAIFAEVNQIAVGCGGICLYREMPSPDNPTGMCAYLMNIYTKEIYRGNGIGRAIVEWLIDYAKRKSITKIYLETSECGRMLYQKLGFQDMKDYLILRKDLPCAN